MMWFTDILVLMNPNKNTFDILESSKPPVPGNYTPRMFHWEKASSWWTHQNPIRTYKLQTYKTYYYPTILSFNHCFILFPFYYIPHLEKSAGLLRILWGDTVSMSFTRSIFTVQIFSTIILLLPALINSLLKPGF